MSAEGALDPDEAAFVDAFVAPQRRERWKLKLASARRRAEFLRDLDHGDDYVAAARRAIPPSEHDARSIAARLRALGAPPECRVLSSRRAWDGRAMALDEALELVVGAGFGAVLACVPGRVAFVEREGDRFLLVAERGAGSRRDRA